MSGGPAGKDYRSTTANRVATAASSAYANASSASRPTLVPDLVVEHSRHYHHHHHPNHDYVIIDTIFFVSSACRAIFDWLLF